MKTVRYNIWVNYITDEDKNKTIEHLKMLGLKLDYEFKHNKKYEINKGIEYNICAATFTGEIENDERISELENALELSKLGTINYYEKDTETKKS